MPPCNTCCNAHIRLARLSPPYHINVLTTRNIFNILPPALCPINFLCNTWCKTLPYHILCAHRSQYHSIPRSHQSTWDCVAPFAVTTVFKWCAVHVFGGTGHRHSHRRCCSGLSSPGGPCRHLGCRSSPRSSIMLRWWPKSRLRSIDVRHRVVGGYAHCRNRSGCRETEATD